MLRDVPSLAALVDPALAVAIGHGGGWQARLGATQRGLSGRLLAGVAIKPIVDERDGSRACAPQWHEIVLDDVPQHWALDHVVLVAQEIAEASNFSPLLPRASASASVDSLLAASLMRLKQRSTASTVLSSAMNWPAVIPDVYRRAASMFWMMSWKRRRGALEGKVAIPIDFLLSARPRRRLDNEIDGMPEHL
jgi:hypothetical protein